MFIGKRKIKAPDFSEGSRASQALREGSVVRQYIQRIAYDYTVADGTGAGAPFADAAYRLIRAVQVNVGGTLIFVNGHTLGKIVKLWYPALYPQTDPSDDAAATYADLEALIPIPMFMPWSMNPGEFGFPASSEPGGTLLIDWANALELLDSDADATAASFANITTELYEHHYRDHGRAPLDFSGVQIRRKELAIDSSGSPQLDLDHLKPGMELRAVMLEAFQDGAAGVRHEYSDALVDDVRIEVNGEDVVDRTPWGVLQADNVSDYELSSRETGVCVAFDAAAQKRTGWGNLPVVRSGEPVSVYLSTTAQSGECKVVATTIAAVSSAARRQGRARAA